MFRICRTNLPVINKPLKRRMAAKPMTQGQGMILLGIMMGEPQEVIIQSEEHFMEMQPKEVRSDDFMFFPLAVLKRVLAMGLPIRFTNKALLALLALSDRIGCTIMILVDCLDEYCKHVNGIDNKLDEFPVITVEHLIALYPMGCYDFDDNNTQLIMELTIKRNKDNFDFKTKEDKRERWAFVYE